LEDATQVTADGAFSVDDLGDCSLEEWHRIQIAEQLAALGRIETSEQLEAFYLAMRGQQQFRHFGAWYARREVDPETGEVRGHKNSGGAGSSRRQCPPSQVICPLHPAAPVRRSPTPALRSALVPGEGGVLIPSATSPPPQDRTE
jgi:hypothetical protein